MSLNISKGNMYDFVTHTWNPIKGKCYHDCSYCYMKRWGELKTIRFVDKELKTDLGENNFIFVGSSCDVFAENIPGDWIRNTLTKCNWYNNKYLFQSKNPARMGAWLKDEYLNPEKVVVCTTIETNRFYPEIMMNAPSPIQRAHDLEYHNEEFKRYVTIEPIIDFDLPKMIKLIKQCNPVQVNIGADSGGNNLPEPSKEKLGELIPELQKFTIIHNKQNLRRLLK